jgi:S-formylglutathione hydrolase FrmB
MKALVLLSFLAATNAGAQALQWDGGVTRVDTIQSPSLRKNLIGDASERPVTVYLPPGYSKTRTKRYPVIYLLHGFDGDHRQFVRGGIQNLNIRLTMDSLIRAAAVREMIVVMPSALNFFQGSFYANSVVTGNWEDFVVRDLMSHIDRKYRTLRRREARGIAGWSMGGYAALRIAMRNPDKFSAVYALSACCLAAMDAPERAAGWKAAVRTSRREDYPAAGFTAHLLFALAAIYSPNPSKPPFYVDLPYRLESDSLVIVPEIAARWQSGPLALASTHLDALRRMEIAFDAGTRDALTDIPVNARALDSLLTANQVKHTAELYDGTHGSRIRERIETKLLPFFSRALH